MEAKWNGIIIIDGESLILYQVLSVLDYYLVIINSSTQLMAAPIPTCGQNKKGPTAIKSVLIA